MATTTAAIESLRSRSRASGAQSNDLCLHVGWREEKRRCVSLRKLACLIAYSFVLFIIVASPLCPATIQKQRERDRELERVRESEVEREREREREREKRLRSL